MRETFGKAFGFVFGLYAAMIAIQLVDMLLPEKYQVTTDKKSKAKSSDFEEEA